MNWSTSCPDWETRIVNKESLIPLPLFPEEAQAALEVFKSLRIVDLPGKPTMGEACAQWVFDFVAAIFGAYDAVEGKRLINKFFLLISKKNTKSTIAAGVMLTALIRNWRHYAESYILAPTKEVADNSFIPAMGMIDEDEELKALFHVQNHYKKITNLETNSFLKIVAADSSTVSGKKGSFILIDEVWEFGKNAKSENMLREVCGGQVSRAEGFIIYLTTMSDEAPAGIFKKELSYARSVRDGNVEDKTYLPITYEFPQKYIDEERHKDPQYWYITNPNMGLSVSYDWLVSEYGRMQEFGEDSVQGFLAKHLNVELGVVLKSKRWSGADFWTKCARGIDLDYILEKSDVIVLGIDGGGLDDMLGLAVIGRDTASGNWLLWNRAWLYRSAVELRKSEKSKYLDFERDGDLEIIDGHTHDDVIEEMGLDPDVITDAMMLPVDLLEEYEKIVSKYAIEELAGLVDVVKKCEASGLLDRIGVDPGGIGLIVDAIEEIETIDSESRIVGVPQGWRLSGSIKTAGIKLANGTIKHSNQPLMAWCVGNARQEQKGNNVLITKQASGTCKIDPLVATFCAVALMAMNPEARNTVSIYESRGIVSF